MTVESQIMAQIDHLGAYKEAGLAALTGRAQIWQMVDDAQDQDYEVAVKSAAISNVDDSLDTFKMGQRVGEWRTLTNQYFAQAGLIDTLNSSNINTFQQALSFWRWRMPEGMADILSNLTSAQPLPERVFPFSYSLTARPLGTFEADGVGSGTFTPGTAVDTTVASAGVIGAIITGNPIGGTDLKIQATLTRADGTSYVDDDVDTFTAGTAAAPALSADNFRAFGRRLCLSGSGGVTIGGVANLTTLTVAPFVVGQYVIVQELILPSGPLDPANHEVAVVLAVDTPGNKLTLGRVGTTTAGLRRAYADAIVIPCWTAVTSMDIASGGPNGTVYDTITASCVGDRTIGLENLTPVAVPYL